MKTTESIRNHIRVAFKGGPVYPDRARASQPETNENHGKHKKPYKSCIQGWPTGMAYIHTYIVLHKARKRHGERDEE